MEKNKLICYTFFAFIIIMTLYPLAVPGIVQGFDWHYHLLRIESIKEGILAHEFPVKIHSLPIDGYGYGSGLFYPQLFLYIPAIFRVCGMSIDFANKLFLCLITFARMAIAYYCSKRMFNSRYVSIFTTTLFTLSPVVFFKFYIAFAYSDNIGYIFTPLIIYGVYNFLHEDFDKPYIIGIGFLGIFLCHLISTVFMIIAVIMMIIMNYKMVFKSLKNFFVLCLTAGYVLLLSAFYWVPMIEQLLNDKFYVSEPWGEFLENSRLFKQILKYGSEYVPVYMLIVLVCILIIMIIVSFIILMFKLKNVDQEGHNIEKKFSIQFLYATGFCIIAMTELFPWRFFVSMLGFIQFPGRFIFLVDIFLAFGLPISLSLFIKSKKKREVSIIWSCFVLVIVNTIIMTFMFKHPKIITQDFLMSYTKMNHENMEYDGKRIFRYDIGWGKEYIPLDTNLYLLTNKDTIISDSGERLKGTRRGSTLKVVTDYNINSEYLDFPLLYYKGYEALAFNDQSSTTKLEVQKGENNTLRVLCNGNSYKEIIVSYSGTKARKASELVSVIFLIISIVWISFKFLKTKVKAS